MLLDPATVAEKVHHVGAFLRADGADLVLLRTDPGTAEIELRLELGDAHCEDCVLPPDRLRTTVEHALRRELRTEFELLLDDPRTAR